MLGSGRIMLYSFVHLIYCGKASDSKVVRSKATIRHLAPPHLYVYQVGPDVCEAGPTRRDWTTACLVPQSLAFTISKARTHETVESDHLGWTFCKHSLQDTNSL